jgi:Fur family ferric uptake transcriptional regulator
MWRFELQRGSADHKRQHPHFLCTDCGEVSCLPETAIALKAGGGTPKAFKKGALAVQVQGQCDDCQRAG